MEGWVRGLGFLGFLRFRVQGLVEGWLDEEGVDLPGLAPNPPGPPNEPIFRPNGPDA